MTAQIRTAPGARTDLISYHDDTKFDILERPASTKIRHRMGVAAGRSRASRKLVQPGVQSAPVERRAARARLPHPLWALGAADWVAKIPRSMGGASATAALWPR